MPVQSYEALRRALKNGSVSRVYYLFGTEDLLKDEAARAIADAAVDRSLRDFNFDERAAAQLDPESLHSLVNTLPMMADRRVVIIRELEAWQKKAKARGTLLQYLQHPSADTVLVLIQGSADAEPDPELTGSAVAVNCESLTADETLGWLGSEAKRRGVALEPDAAEHLVKVVGNDLRSLRSELEKLAALADGQPITASRLASLVGVRHGETLYDWRDAVLDDRSARALSLLGPVLEQPGVSGVRLITTLGWTLIGVGMARGLYERNTRGRPLENAVADALFKRIRPYGWLRDLDWRVEARNWVRWASRWPAPRLRQAIAATLAADRALKSTRISDDRAVLADLIAQLMLSRQEVA